MSTFSRTATLFSTVVLGSMLTTTTVSSVNTIVNAAETTQAVATKKNYDLKILQANSDATSTASQFYLNTISLEKQANGNYYAYLTSNTPVKLGDEPISSEDTQHQVVKMGTTQKNGYNQTVYRLTLTADELASGQPIKTRIHVNIPMINYDHDYDIRLAIQGFKPEAASSSSSSSSSSTTNSSSSVSSSSNNARTSTANSSTTTSVAPSSSSQASSSAQSSNNDTATSSVVNNTQNNSSDTASSAVVSDDTTTSSTDSTVNISADQGMSRFLKPTAHIDVKGEQTDITLSLNDASLAKMIPSLTLDGQTKSVSGQDTTFTVPTKDLTPDKDGKLTLKSLTHVSAQGYTHDYPSNITFDVSQLIAQNNLKTGSYQIAVSPDSQMDKFFAKEFNVKVGALTSVVSVTYQVPSMMGMIPSVTFDGQTESVVNKSTTTDFTIPTKDLVPGKDGKVTLKSFTSVPMSPSKGYNSNITFDMNPALVKSTSDGSDSSSSSSESTASSDKDILQDGTYSINYNVYKSGTTTDSTMKTYMKSPANVAVKNGQATITFTTQNDAMSMMKEFSANGATAKADGDNWVVTVPVSALSKTMTSNMTIFVSAINFTEHPSADIVFDMSSIKKTGNNGGGSAASSSSASSSSHASSASSSSKVSSSSSSHASSASSSSKASSASSSHASSASSSSQNAAKTDITKDGNYSVNYSVYKTGTKTDSTMKTYMKSPANVAVKNGQATITFATQNDAMSMMKEFSVNDVAAKADGNNWVVTVPVSALSKTMTSNMTIFVSAINFTEHPSADIVFDMSSVKKTGNNGGGSAASSSSASSSSHASSASSSSKVSSSSSSHASSASSSSKVSSSSSSHASSASSSSKVSSSSSSHASSASSSSKVSSSSSSHASSASSSSKVSSSSSSHASSASSSSQSNSKTDITKDGKYSVNYHVYKSGTTTDSTMVKYMTSSATVAVNNSKATITFATQNDAMSMMKEFSVNGATAKADGDNWVVTVPVSALSKTMTANMTIVVSAINFTEHPSADIVFDMSSVKKTGNNGGGSATSSSSASSSSHASSASSSSKASSASSSHASSASSSSQNATKPDITKDGNYSINYSVYKTGTKTPSTMQQYMTSTAIVDVKKGKATINFKTQNGAMSLMKYFAVNGHKAQAKENGWQVTLPASDLLHTLTSNMTIYVPKLNFTEKPSADIVFDVKSAQFTKQTGDLGSNKQTTPPNNQATTANNLGSQNRLDIPNATLHQLTILQANSNSSSVAAQYFLPTIQLVKNSNGSYTGYVTTHTPAMMGSAPITFMDGTHHVTRMSNFKTGNYYQAVYRFSLSANEIKAPIATTIHVHFTAPLAYDHTYTIRFVIGRTLNNASEATQPTTGLPNMSDNTLTTALNTSDVSRGTSDPVATGTFENTSANTDSAFSQQSDEKANKPKHSDKKDTVKSDTNVSKDTKADQKDNTTRRNILIVAGGVIAAALGYVGVSLLTNFFKKG
ncbi:hypothetical protein G9403_04920 [Weissella paramesenteroides]|uniref:NEAT domain-containing protein n=1 Tax=Weissella paramesenteroides TaxID=1249 RepID=A0ABD4XI72_WEIPA|nr:NEAT domain-containing protein [Weissella paramesenteroides]MDF8368991.1 hypothetical protein [Weissella paramesenteroides]MDF8371004.1 hypothetical protein [Weissella paramesenteroides]